MGGQLIRVPCGPHLESKILQNAATETENSIWGREGAKETLADSKLLSALKKKKNCEEIPSRGSQPVGNSLSIPLQLHTQGLVQHSLAALPSCARQIEGVVTAN